MKEKSKNGKKKWILAIVIVAAVILLAGGGVLWYLSATSDFGISVIGGADGPTSVFIAGKLNPVLPKGLVAAGVVLLAGIGIWFWKKKR